MCARCMDWSGWQTICHSINLTQVVIFLLWVFSVSSALLPDKYVQTFICGLWIYVLVLCNVFQCFFQICVLILFLCSTHEEDEKETEDEYGGHLNPFTTYYKSSWWSVYTQNRVQTNTAKWYIACWFNDEKVWDV